MNGELDFKASLQACRFIEGIRGLYLSENCEQMDVTPGAKVLITELHQRGYKVGLFQGIS